MTTIERRGLVRAACLPAARFSGAIVVAARSRVHFARKASARGELNFRRHRRSPRDGCARDQRYSARRRCNARPKWCNRRNVLAVPPCGLVSRGASSKHRYHVLGAGSVVNKNAGTRRNTAGIFVSRSTNRCPVGWNWQAISARKLFCTPVRADNKRTLRI